MARLTDEGRDAIRRSNQRRNRTCGKCGATGVTVLDGSKVGGMPGINYQFCDGCGWSRAITVRPKKEKLRG